MKVLGHIHTYNDADIIDGTLKALLNQTRPLCEIIVVDNGSTDGTLERTFPDRVTVLKHEENLGTNGAVITGFRYALEHSYDWIWLFDADSVAEPDAVEKLLELYAGWGPELRAQVGFLASLPLTRPDDSPMHGGLFTPRGITPVVPDPGEPFYSCHVTIWSGCLYRLAAVRDIGLPSPDYVLDWGEFEYAYRIKKAGLRGFIHQRSILHHNIRGLPSLSPSSVTLGPLTLTTYEFPPIRCYYMTRNMIYFGLHELQEHRLATLRGITSRVLRLLVNFLVQPVGHGPQIRACLRGVWHGLTKNIEARY